MKYKLIDIFDLQMGKTPDRNNMDYWNSGTEEWISIADLSKCGKYITETKEKITKAAVEESKIKYIPDNTVIMSFKLSIGKLAITERKMYSNEAIMAFIDKKIVDIVPSYLYYLFMHKDWNEGTNKAVMGKTLNKATLSQMSIEIHELKEQHKIVQVLDKVYQLIEERKKQLEELDNLIKSQFIEMFGTLDTNEKNFDYAPLKELCNKITDGKHGGCESVVGTGYYFVGAREIYDGLIHYDTAPEIAYSDFEKDYKRCNVEKGDFLIVNTGATIGKSAIALDERTEKTLLQKSVALIKTKKNILLPVFLKYCYMVNPQMYLVESSSAQPNLLLSKIKETVIYVPSIDLQNEFANFVQQVDKLKFKVQQSLNETQLLFDSLMQQYFG